jgi:serine protease Do
MRKALPYFLVFFLGFIVCAFVIYELNLVGPGQIQNAAQPAPSTPGIIKPGNNSVRNAAKLVSDYVVNIDTVGRPQMEGGFFPFMAPEEVVPKGQGSGVIITPDGYIVTNNHVVADAAQLTVTTRSGAKYKAKVVGRDRNSDIAVIKIDARGLRTAKFANSSTLQPGDWVIAVGSPYGFEWTVTVGVVSATKRGPIPIGNQVLTDVIQTDTALNPGNSGGALADLNGNLVGINTAIRSNSGGSVGIGFAIPSNTVERVADALMKHGKISHPYLGIRYMPFNADVRSQLEQRGVKGLPNAEGVMVGEVYQNSPAAEAGIQPQDIITKVNGKQLSGSGSAQGSKTTLSDEVAKSKVGQRMLLEVWHASDGRTGTVAVRLAEMPENFGG